MRAVYALVFVLGGAALADDKVDPVTIKAVEGDCVLVTFDGKGVKLTKADVKKLPYARRDIVITGDQITAEFGGKKETVAYKVDDTKTPHHIDLTFARDGKTETHHGIYKVEKGVLTLCVTEPKVKDEKEPKETKDGPTEPVRPTEFKAGRFKSDGDPKTGRDAYLMTVRKRHAHGLEGTYLLTGLAAKGLALTENELAKVPAAERQLVIDDEDIVLMFNGKDEAGTFKLDPTRAPPHINLSITKDNKTETNYGIYKFENGVLTICASTKTAPAARPKEFKTDDPTVTVFVLKQQPRK